MPILKNNEDSSIKNSIKFNHILSNVNVKEKEFIDRRPALDEILEEYLSTMLTLTHDANKESLRNEVECTP